MNIHYFIVRNRFYGTDFWLKAFTLPSLKIDGKGSPYGKMDSSLEFQGQKDCWVNLWQSRTGRDSNSDQIRPYILDVCTLTSSLKSVKKESVERGLIGRKILQKTTFWENRNYQEPFVVRNFCVWSVSSRAPLFWYRQRQYLGQVIIQSFWQFVLWTP